MYKFLEPIQVGGLSLKNRIIYPSMAKYMCDEDGNPTEQYYEYYRTIARSGVSLLVPGAMVIDPYWPYRFQNQPWLNDDKYIPGLKKLVEIVHNEGALIAFQLWHPGESTTDPANKPKSINEMELEEIRHIQKQYPWKRKLYSVDRWVDVFFSICDTNYLWAYAAGCTRRGQLKV